jgi:single-stranded DNA-binding protein
MNQFQVSVTGNVSTPVRHSVTGRGSSVADFRLACTPRRFDKEQNQWADGRTTFVKVTCFGSLADNVTASLAVGQPVVVMGRLQVEENVRDQHTYRDAVVIASAVGPDLSRGTASFRRTAAARGPEVAPSPAQAVATAPAQAVVELPEHAHERLGAPHRAA